jgi:hypothetical protein
MLGQEVADGGKSVSFSFPDGNEYEGSVRRVGGGYELTVYDLPESPWSTIDRLEASAEKSDDTYLFVGVRFRGSSFRGWSAGSSTAVLFSPTATFYSPYPGNPLSGNITMLGAKVDNLDLWFNRSLFSFNFSESAELPHSTLTYSIRERVGSYEFKGFKLSFHLILDGMKSSPLTREVGLRQTPHIELSVADGAEDVSYRELIEALHSVERLLGMAFRSSIRTVEVEVTSKDFDLGIGGDAPSIFPPFGITLSDVRPSMPQVSYSDELAFTFDQLGDFQALINKWAELEESIAPIVDLLLSSVSGGSSVLENIFLNRIQGIEGFHRSFRPGSILPQDEYGRRKDEIISQFTGEKKRLLKKVLRHGNDLSLADRLRSLDAELKAKGIPTIGVCGLDVVANTRNYYSHYEEEITNICPREDLRQLAREAAQMLFALILIELGIDDDVVRMAIARPGVVNPF